ncbi:MAG: hypothetical protein N2643_04595 [Endomicrobia bacterium]|nr:hypothetical protein [Endomicrobiia bacterium]
MIKCQYCGFVNKPETKICKKCNKPLVVEPIWKPDIKWYLKVLGIIYLVLIGLFFLLNYLLKPYMRKIPPEITPWLQTDEQVK